MSLDLLTPDTPRILIVDERNDARYVITQVYNSSGNPGVLSCTFVGNSAGTRAGNASAAITVREIENNVSSGLWAFSYLCNADGTRLAPITEAEWIAACNALRDSKLAVAAAQKEVADRREAFREAEAALASANAAALVAQSRWNSSL